MFLPRRWWMLCGVVQNPQGGGSWLGCVALQGSCPGLNRSSSRVPPPPGSPHGMTSCCRGAVAQRLCLTWGSCVGHPSSRTSSVLTAAPKLYFSFALCPPPLPSCPFTGAVHECTPQSAPTHRSPLQSLCPGNHSWHQSDPGKSALKWAF